jgi:hypothetical protein
LLAVKIAERRKEVEDKFKEQYITAYPSYSKSRGQKGLEQYERQKEKGNGLCSGPLKCFACRKGKPCAFAAYQHWPQLPTGEE